MEAVWGGSHRIADPLKRPKALETSSRFAIAGLVLVGISTVFFAVATLNLHGAAGGVVDLARLPGIHKTYDTWESIDLLCHLVAAAAFIPWFAAAFGNLRRFGVQHVPYSDGWAVGAWFIPFVSMWRPKQIANDIWRGSEADADVGSERWRLGNVSPVVHWWWGLYLTGGIVAAVGATVLSAGYTGFEHDVTLQLATERDMAEIRTGAVIAVLGAVILIAAVVFAVMFVLQATERLEAIRRRLIQAEPVGGYPPPIAVQPAAPPSLFTPPPPPGTAPPPPAAPPPGVVPPQPPGTAPPPPAQGVVSCPDCAELVVPQGSCPYCGYAFGGPVAP